MIQVNVTDELVAQALVIHKASFEGLECAPTAMFRNRCRTNLLFADIDNGVMKGYAIVEDRDPFHWLWEIAVAPEFRRQGVAGRLLESIANYVFVGNDGHGIELTVKRSNQAAILTYMSHNFYTVRILKRYYMGDGDGVLMRRDTL